MKNQDENKKPAQQTYGYGPRAPTSVLHERDRHKEGPFRILCPPHRGSKHCRQSVVDRIACRQVALSVYEQFGALDRTHVSISHVDDGI
ncbi:hypothetical protein QE152_g12592 [Popillia japonica]|uniref:Uncharacterized protein n=1 Tax=Popillia japonica TaxID=7064 RepID=A0AAW1LQL0_POPJA